MKLRMKFLLFLWPMITSVHAEVDIIQIQDAIMRKIPTMLKEGTLINKQIIDGCTVMKRLITKQKAEDDHLYELKKHMLNGKEYVMVSISKGKGERKRKSLGGGILVILYDKDTYEPIFSKRTR